MSQQLTKADKKEGALQTGANGHAVEKIEKIPTGMHHVFLIDWYDDGRKKEIAVVLEKDDGTIYGIIVDQLHPMDKARLKKFLVSVHADKYPLWQLLDQGRLNNGVNPLDFFHNNYVKVKYPKGALVGGGLASIDTSTYQAALGERQIGSEFADPRGGFGASPANGF